MHHTSGAELEGLVLLSDGISPKRAVGSKNPGTNFLFMMRHATPGASSRKEIRVLTTANSGQGFILLDSRLRPVAYNSEAVQILSFPTKPDSIKQLPQFLGDKVRSTLVNGGSAEMPEFVRECKAGRRTYSCRAFRIDCNNVNDSSTLISFAILLERHVSNAAALANLAREFELTARECETVALLLEGLTSKEIASRMHISPNTVKAFLRLVMVKMNVSTRSGIVGKALGSTH